MRTRSIKIAIAVAAAAGLTALAATTAWADTFTPGIEEPTAGLGIPGAPNVTGTPSDGNYSSATGTPGRSYGDGDGSGEDSFGDPSAGDPSFGDDAFGDRDGDGDGGHSSDGDHGDGHSSGSGGDF